MKQSILALKSFFETGDKPTQQEFRDLIDSFVHQDSGIIIDHVAYSDNEDVIFTFTNGEVIIIPKYQLPNEMPISFITDLQAALINKTETGGYAGTAQDLYSLITAIKTIYSFDGTIDEERTIDGSNRSGSLVFDSLEAVAFKDNNKLIVENNLSVIDTDAFLTKSKNTIELKLKDNVSKVSLNKDGVSIQNGTEAPGRYLQSVDANGKTVWKDLEISDLSGVAAMVQDMLINSGATDKIASVKAIEDFVSTKISELVDNSPGALDTLKELADALGNDPDFATTMTTQIASKLA